MKEQRKDQYSMIYSISPQMVHPHMFEYFVSCRLKNIDPDMSWDRSGCSKVGDKDSVDIEQFF